ncbi:MAG: penicillin-binding protein activator [Alphaproteobacteria bacterium]|nr:penicillin-binding protein activator [Alphaproteobacteria bacterium]
MIGKIAGVCGFLLIAACAAQKEDPFMQPMFGQVPSVYGETQEIVATTKIAVLLPLTGKSAELGKDMQKAAMMAEFDKRQSGATVVFYDTMGISEGAEAALKQAEKIHPAMMVGPVFSAETIAVREEGVDVPVLSFTSDSESVDDDVYTVALMIPNQVERIVEFACKAGQRKIAVVGPENKVGEIVMNTLSETIKKCPNMEMKQVSLYVPTTVNFDPVVAKIAPQPIDSRRKDLTDEEKELLLKPIAEKVDFDALLVFEDGVKLQQVMSMLSYYDITPSDIPIYGLSSWGGMKISELVGGYFPAMPANLSSDFNRRFYQTFGSKPSALAAYAYDAVSLGILLGSTGAINTTGLLNERGFNGVNGRFRLNKDGTNTRLLDMRQIISKNRSSIVDKAPSVMSSYEDEQQWFVSPEIQMQEDVGFIPAQ